MSPNWTKLKCEFGTQKGHWALLECPLAQIQGSAWGPPDQDKAYLFRFFRDKDAFQFVSNHSANFLKHSNLYK